MKSSGRAKPMPYQKEGVYCIEDFDGRVLLADEMGLGKTLQVLWALRRNPSWLPALIVCPASVKYNWEFEALHHVNFQSSICEGQTPPEYNRNDFSFQSPLTIINYDILKYWVPYLQKLKFKTIILDECQAIQNPRAQRTRAVKEITKKKPHVIAVSGTPLTNRPRELWPTLKILWPKSFGSFWTFAQSYCKPKWTPWGFTYDGASNLDRLHRELLLHGMIRRRKQDVLKDLPDKIRVVQPLEMSDPDEYNEASRDFLVWLRKNHAHKIRSASRAQKLTQLGYLLRLSARLKLKSAIGWANRFLEETDEKLILFAVHRKAISAMKRRIKAQSVIVDGTVTGRDRQRAVDQFQKDKKTRVFIGNLQAAGVGITLTAASTVGFFEIGWRPGDHIQAEDRPHRIGQKNNVWIHYLVAGGTKEERLCEILQEKQQVISSVLDGGPTPVDLNIYDLLLNELEKEALKW